MYKVFNLSLLEYKKVIERPGIYIGMLLSTLYSAAILTQAVQYPKLFQSKHVYAFFASIAGIVILIYAGKTMAEEFRYRTSTSIFVKVSSRSIIVFSKLIGLCLIGLTFALLNTLLVTIAKILLNNNVSFFSICWDLLKVCFVYLVYTFCVGSFGILISIISFNIVASIVASLGCFYFFSSTAELFAQKFNILKMILSAFPFYSATPTLTYFSFGKIEIISLVISGVVFALMSCAVLRKRDLI